jgi:hypothetical protein
MQLVFSPTSPDVRKVRVSAIEKALEGCITPIRGNGGVARLGVALASYLDYKAHIHHPIRNRGDPSCTASPSARQTSTRF